MVAVVFREIGLLASMNSGKGHWLYGTVANNRQCSYMGMQTGQIGYRPKSNPKVLPPSEACDCGLWCCGFCG